MQKFRYIPKYETRSYSYNLEDKTAPNPNYPYHNNFLGEDHEKAVAQLLWDLYDDDTNEWFDDVSLGINGLYNLLRVNPKYTVHDVWTYLTGTVPPGPNYLNAMTYYGAVFANHGMGATGLYSVSSSGLSSVYSWSPGDPIPDFIWDNPKTAQGKYELFDTYYLEFYDPLGNKILTATDIYFWQQLGVWCWSPSVQQWYTIADNLNVLANHKVYWVVRCTNFWDPNSDFNPAIISGPYWSDQVGKIDIF